MPAEDCWGRAQLSCLVEDAPLRPSSVLDMQWLDGADDVLMRARGVGEASPWASGPQGPAPVAVICSFAKALRHPLVSDELDGDRYLREGDALACAVEDFSRAHSSLCPGAGLVLVDALPSLGEGETDGLAERLLKYVGHVFVVRRSADPEMAGSAHLSCYHGKAAERSLPSGEEVGVFKEELSVSERSVGLLPGMLVSQVSAEASCAGDGIGRCGREPDPMYGRSSSSCGAALPASRLGADSGGDARFDAASSRSLYSGAAPCSAAVPSRADCPPGSGSSFSSQTKGPSSPGPLERQETPVCGGRAKSEGSDWQPPMGGRLICVERRVISDARARLGGKESDDVVPTGLRSLDRILQGGLRRGRLTLVVENSGVRQGSFAGQVALSVAKTGRPVFMATGSQSVEEFSLWAVMNQTGVDLDAASKGLCEGDGQKLRDLELKFNGWGYAPALRLFDGRDVRSPDDLAGIPASKACLFVVDGLAPLAAGMAVRMRRDGLAGDRAWSGPAVSRRSCLMDCVDVLVEVARKGNCAVVATLPGCLSASDDVAGRSLPDGPLAGWGEPGLWDYCEDRADLVISVDRASLQPGAAGVAPDLPTSDSARLSVWKCRFCAPGTTVEVAFDAGRGTFCDLPESNG